MWSLVILGGLACAQTSPPSKLVADGSIERSVTSNATTAQKPVPDLPPPPPDKATLLGGTIANIDHVRDRITLQLFGGGHTTILFDERTRVFRDGKAGSVSDLKNGQRAYVDSVLDGTAVFAKNIRIAEAIPVGQSSGQVLSFEPGSRELTLRDSISPDKVKMRLAPNAVILRADRPATPAELQPGTLVNLAFAPSASGPATVRQILILASPGAAFVFSGRVEFLDLRRALLVVVDPRDNKSYEVGLDNATRRLTRDLREGLDVSVNAVFDGKRYQARAITITPPATK